MNKNDINKQFVYRAVNSKVSQLLREPQNVTPVENLARVQSLLLYQIMRLYDDDVLLSQSSIREVNDTDSL